MNEQELEELLKAFLEGEPVRFEEPGVEPGYAGSDVSTFEEAGLGARHRGLVVRTGTGEEFRITVEKIR
ncbi:MAG: hypothetical protein LC740_17170 [Actinobacteria bacterium]|jgi:hypothetical protein|nr:hypothetical protein [Actinomycetota bacterium]